MYQSAKKFPSRKIHLKPQYPLIILSSIFRACMKANVCVNCKGRQSELLCDTSFIPANTPADPETASQNADVHGSSPQCDTPTKTISCCNVNTTHDEVFIETRRALMVNEKKEINL
ncbi:hypothetical protein TNCV_4249111 [Trichonephila clavipes]|nr:hypothetical protein TNCV_4249111 [Trichonephila clavipes]